MSKLLQLDKNVEIEEGCKEKSAKQNFELEQDIIFATTQLENLKPIQPKKTITVKGKIKITKKGAISKV